MTTANNTYYTYLLRRSDNNEIFWAGKGKDNRAQKSTNPNQTLNINKKNIINELKNKNLNIIIEYVLENVSEQAALDKEFELINKYGRICDGSGSLANIANERHVKFNDNWMNKNNRKYNPKMSKNNRKFNLTKQELIKELTNLTQMQIAEKYGVGQCAVSKTKNYYNININKSKNEYNGVKDV